jgi:undecaprenyl-diphosphatase
MFDLTKPWPLGIDRHNWPRYAIGVGVVLVIVVWFDVWASQGAISWPAAWRAPFFFITDYGLAEWTLVPSLGVFVIAGLVGLALRPGVWKRASFELSSLGGFVFACVGLPGLIVTVLKRLIGRSRPEVYDAAGAFDFQLFLNSWTHQSFPSGHTQTAASMAFAVGFLWPRAFPWFLAIGIAVGISRVPVGAHYPTDVVAGFVVGLLGSYWARNIFAKRRWIFSYTVDGHVRPRGFPAMRRLAQRLRQRPAA